jgi:catechol 2,3-dioxygenase-like lactoylglutathione lyase family enzyme
VRVRVSCDNHVGLRTSDIDAATRFWCEALGAQTSEPSPTTQSGPVLDLVFGEGTRVKISHVVFPAGGWLELFEFVEPRLELPSSRPTLDLLMHLAFTVDDIDEGIRRIAAAGGRTLHDPIRLAGVPDGPMSVNCLSPQGHPFQLLTIDYGRVVALRGRK